MYYSFYLDLGMLFVRILNSKLLLSLLVGNGCRTDAEFSFLRRKQYSQHNVTKSLMDKVFPFVVTWTGTDPMNRHSQAKASCGWYDT